uniref:WAP domain-containing protein n=1 Tax=Syphacia muris TaxID=451379 RepID=A0A0N5AAR2_9BILA
MELWISIALVSLISTVALAQDDVFDPTSRDYTYKCESMAKKAREGEQCPLFEMCCNTFAGDRMNGDKCQLPDPKNGCEYNEQTGETIMLCKAYNCTEMVTTTTTTTTPRPIRIETKGSSSKTDLSANFLPPFSYLAANCSL